MTQKEEKRMNELYQDNRAKQQKIVQLEQENEALKKEQQDFQNELRKAIDKIRAMKGIVRWFQTGKLIWQLITTIESGFKE